MINLTLKSTHIFRTGCFTLIVLWLSVLCVSFSRCRGLVCSLWLWHLLVILTYFLESSLILKSSLRGRESWLLYFNCVFVFHVIVVVMYLFLVVPWISLCTAIATFSDLPNLLCGVQESHFYCWRCNAEYKNPSFMSVRVWSKKSSWCQSVILGTNSSIPPSHSWWILIISHLRKQRKSWSGMREMILYIQQ